MEEKKEITVEMVEKELGRTVEFFRALTQKLMDRYNEFHRMCDHREKQLEKDIEHRLEYLGNRKKSIYKMYDEEYDKIEREIRFLLKKMSSVRKILEEKMTTATEQAKIDAKNDYDE